MDSCHRTLMYNVKAQTTTFQDVCKNSESVKLFPSFILIANWLKYLYHTELDNNNCKHLSNSQVSRNTTHRKLIFFKCWRQIHCIWLFHSSIKGMWYRWFPCTLYQTRMSGFSQVTNQKWSRKKSKYRYTSMRMRCLALVALSLFLKTLKFRYVRVVRLTHDLWMTYHLLPINVACQQLWNK